MAMSLLALAAIVAIGGLWWTRARRPHGLKPSAAAVQARASSPYKSAALRCGSGACEAAQRLDGQRMLARDIPLIPLTDCDQANCQCHYERFDDRRTEHRRDPSPMVQANFSGTFDWIPRKARGRRKEDQPLV